MSDEKPDLAKRSPSSAGESGVETPATDATASETATRPSRPAAPGAAAARRARQLGGARRPSPRPSPETTASTVEDADTATPSPAKAERSAATTAAPRSSVGKAAARPRPRPRPAPVDAEDDEDDETTTTDAEAAVTRTGRRRGVLLAAGSVLTVLFLAAGVVFLVLTVTAKAEVSPRETDRAVAAAKADVALVTSYGYQTVDADAAKAAAVLTGEFKDQYLDAIAKTVKPQLPTTQTVSTGQVDAAGVVSADSRGRQVVVLVYGQQSVTDKAQTTPRIDAFQVRVTMQRVGSDWLVAKLEQLGNNA